MELDLSTFIEAKRRSKGTGYKFDINGIKYVVGTKDKRNKTDYCKLSIGKNISDKLNLKINSRLTAYYKDGIMVLKIDNNGRKCLFPKGTTVVNYYFPYTEGFPDIKTPKLINKIYFETNYIHFNIDE
jgi:hypothetical protein